MVKKIENINLKYVKIRRYTIISELEMILKNK